MGSLEESLHVVIVGAGLGGLALAIACRRQGFKVTVFEWAPKLLPIGDSIGFGCNSSRILERWGLMPELEALTCKAEFCAMNDWNGNHLGIDRAQGEAKAKYGVPSLVVHRGDAHQIFLDHAIKNGADVRLDAKVVDYDNDKPSVTLQNGEVHIGDVVIASDGVKSLGRKQVLGYFDKPLHSGYSVWRAYVDASEYQNDPLVKKFVEKGDTFTLWIGKDVHAFVITTQDGGRINATMTHTDDADVEEGWMSPGYKKDILENLKGADPSLVRVWELIPEDRILDWKLVYRRCLDKWVADSGLVAIMGDAAHPFLPSSSQGGSQAIEDGATIAMCLAKAGKANIPLALHTYFEIRHDHVLRAQQAGITQRDKWHHNHDDDGKLVKEIKKSEEDILDEPILDSSILWHHDAEKVCEEKYPAASAKVASKLGIAKVAS
ncbi:FAD/NAD(P)-binding domain-containing protein [Cucurbitaria berberidis CBS 394.84]|uniref:FAD/NAD(P)-binding domain-containing protein n=1 Tax=Cucurbitaria berberidis CBS 394.84 TaxID=1168544 RepID=A0A9P4L6U1_9PLEO|nr:FAD/NAD(P)-binding domain-containing protein [Cucurbitaria berberidis CBS 394.84]KAF1843682.1 FAD/NAD(P)-binding domain-containing protein [Cucurbitaria berberidis CBS 394.84]